MSIRFPAASSRNFDPVTVSVAPRNVKRIRREYPRSPEFNPQLTELLQFAYHYLPMDSTRITNLDHELRRRAEDKFGRERAEALHNDLQQMAHELEALEKYNVDFDDEP